MTTYKKKIRRQNSDHLFSQIILNYSNLHYISGKSYHNTSNYQPFKITQIKFVHQISKTTHLYDFFYHLVSVNQINVKFK
jgi:hypothetical protein